MWLVKNCILLICFWQYKRNIIDSNRTGKPMAEAMGSINSSE